MYNKVYLTLNFISYMSLVKTDKIFVRTRGRILSYTIYRDFRENFRCMKYIVKPYIIREITFLSNILFKFSVESYFIRKHNHSTYCTMLY